MTNGRELVVLGGLDATKFSTAAVVRVDASTGTSRPAGTLAEAVHDAAGARLGNAVLVLGGGGPSENGTADVQTIPANGATTVVGELPQPRSDHVAVTVGGKAYVLGGYDGHNIIADVLSTDDGKSFTNVGALPVPVRYPAVAAVGKMIYLFGGVMNSQAGIDTSVVQRLDTANGKREIVAQLPTSLSHASAMVLDGQVFVVRRVRQQFAAQRPGPALQPDLGHHGGRGPSAHSDLGRCSSGDRRTEDSLSVGKPRTERRSRR